MLRRYQRTVGHLFRVTDACLMVFVWLLSCRAYYMLPTPHRSFARVPAEELPDLLTHATLAPLVAVLWVSVFTMMGAYESRRMLGRLGEIALLLKAHSVAILIFSGLAFAFRGHHYSASVVMTFAIFGAIALVIFRVTLRGFLRTIRLQGFNLRSVLVVGEGKAVELLIRRLDQFPELGLRVKGVATLATSFAEHRISAKPVLGTLAEVPAILNTVQIDEVLIALPPSRSLELDRLLEQLRDETVSVRVVLDIDHHATLGCEVEEFDGLPVVRLNDSPLIGLSAIAKRATDAVLSAVLLVVLSPVLLLIAILVKLTSPGPVFYAQERMGLDGRAFKMFKFRSMRVDAETQTGAVWARAGDERRTAFGAFLRKTSLDELPQFWNVLRGDMSLVGPRPERPVFVQRFRKEIPHYMLRHKVRAGITGWAQVNGWRGNTSLERRIECDLFYIRNWSYLFDLKILTMTLWKGFTNKNAY